jgi:hypothetical protein
MFLYEYPKGSAEDRPTDRPDLLQDFAIGPEFGDLGTGIRPDLPLHKSPKRNRPRDRPITLARDIL